MIPIEAIHSISNSIKQAQACASAGRMWSLHDDWIQHKIVAEEYYARAYSLGRQAFELWDFAKESK